MGNLASNLRGHFLNIWMFPLPSGKFLHYSHRDSPQIALALSVVKPLFPPTRVRLPSMRPFFAGGKPVLADIKPETYFLDPHEVRRLISEEHPGSYCGVYRVVMFLLKSMK